MKFITIFFLAYANLGYALSLGNITLKSHLGEPLSASIIVTDVENSTGTDCFSVSDVSDVSIFKKSILSLSPNHNDYQLNIGTRDAITEPIVNLRVSFTCEPLFQRDYVLLLDPAPLTKRTFNTTTLTNSEVLALQAQAENQGNLLQVETPPSAPTKQPIKKKKRKKAANTKSATDKALMVAYTGKQDVLATASSEPLDGTGITKQVPAQDRTSKPYLTISGGNQLLSENISQPSLALRLETQIDFSRMETAPLTQQDAMDEVTVMANRLAHLEKQIINLQTKNAQLLTETEKARNTNFQFSQWLHYLLVIGSIFAILAAAEWIRRKLMRSRLMREQAFWFADKKTDPAAETMVSNGANKNSTDSIFDDLSFGQSTGNPYSGLTNTAAFTVDTNDVNENILENAEVFIEHGRMSLAIQLLQNHLTDYPTESPKVWFKLLSLVASEGSEVEYDSTATNFKQFFNIKIPNFQNANSQDRSSIEDYPHIIARLEGVWGSHYAVELLNELVYSKQSAEPRDGFERGVFEDLFFLKQIAETLEIHASEEQNDLHQSEAVKPAVASTTLNVSTFNDINHINEKKLAQDMSAAADKLTNDEKAIQATFLDADYNTGDACAFDTASNEFELKANFGKAPNANMSAPTIALNTELESLTEDDFAESELANEIDFLIAAGNEIEANNAVENDTLTENQKNAGTAREDKPETKTSVLSNEIEWDLPKPD